MKNTLATIIFVILVLVFPVATFAQDNAKTTKTDSKSTKKSVAVLNFDDASLGNKELSLGKLLVASLTRELVNTKAFDVTEKQQIDAVMKQLNISFDEAMDPKTAAKVGKLVSANTAIFGTINEYNIVSEEINALVANRTRYTATVGLSIRLVDINTGLVIESVESTETAKKDSYATIVGGAKTNESNDLKIKLFTEAANKAVKAVVKQLSPVIQNSDTSKLASQTNSTDTTKSVTTQPQNATTNANREISKSTVSNSSNSSAKVVRVIKDIIFLSGLNDVKVGDILSVVRGAGEGKEIAVIEVTEVNERTVKAKIIQGAGVQENDRVKLIQ